jgi:hypothetical protein
MQHNHFCYSDFNYGKLPERIEDTKGVIKDRISKDRQYNLVFHLQSGFSSGCHDISEIVLDVSFNTNSHLVCIES